jgi:hypothetical protein
MEHIDGSLISNGLSHYFFSVELLGDINGSRHQIKHNGLAIFQKRQIVRHMGYLFLLVEKGLR